MKYILASILLAVSTGVSACKQETASPVVSNPVPQEEVKKETESKRVCIKVYDAKQQKEVEKCRVTKIFEKKEGTPIPK